MRIFFSVGEPSGDLHAANLIRRLKRRSKDVECVGFGGPKMAQAGCHLDEDLTQHAVMGFVRVIGMLGIFLRLLFRADRIFRESRPDAVVLVDFPGFNWWIARRAKAHGIEVFYYGVPQMWAWASWRVKKLRRLVDHVLCKLPFEEEWFRSRGCEATYVGHPFFDETSQRELDGAFLARLAEDQRPLVTILPGSRTHEVEDNLQWFLKAARLVREKAPQVRFAVASFNEKQADFAREAVAEADLSADVFVGKTPELIHGSVCCMACSGSVSLELLHHLKPTVVLYYVNRFIYTLASRWVLKVKHITLVNLIAEESPFTDRPQPFDPASPDAEQVPFPEYATYEDRSQQIAGHVIEWINDERERERKVAQLQSLKDRYGSPGASDRAADYLLAHLGDQPEADRQQAA